MKNIYFKIFAAISADSGCNGLTDTGKIVKYVGIFAYVPCCIQHFA
jgi:hypothetical protein